MAAKNHQHHAGDLANKKAANITLAAHLNNHLIAQARRCFNIEMNDLPLSPSMYFGYSRQHRAMFYHRLI